MSLLPEFTDPDARVISKEEFAERHLRLTVRGLCERWMNGTLTDQDREFLRAIPDLGALVADALDDGTLEAMESLARPDPA